MQSECMVCHYKIQRGQKCPRCVTIVDPNNPLLRMSSQRRETVKCEYCNQDIFLEDFDAHDNNCESKEIIKQCRLEEMRERQQVQEEQRKNHRHQQQQQQQRARSNRVGQMMHPVFRIMQDRLDGLRAREEQEEPIFVHDINHVIRALRFLHINHEHQNQHVNQVQENDLIKIKYQPSQHLSEENKKCMICLSDYEPNDELILLQCAHRFHSECIKDWLKKSVKCPICRHNLQQS